MRNYLPKIIVLLGPTASGKSDLAIKLAKKFNGEIVNADSRNIYKHMYIGTASPFAPKAQELRIKNKELKIKEIKHYLFHFIEPWETYSVGQYKQDVIRVIDDILKRGKLPILTGGTGLYIWAIVDNLQIPEVLPNPKLRKQLTTSSFVLRLRQKLGVDKKARKKLPNNALWDILVKLDPEAAEFVQKYNPQRVIRALEVILTVNKMSNLDAPCSAVEEGGLTSIIKFSDLRRQGPLLYNILQLGLKIPRQDLYKRINKRVDQQIKQGLACETKKILSLLQGTSSLSLRGAKRRSNLSAKNIWQLPSMTGLGYRQIGMYLHGELDLSEALRILKRDTRRYARRQISWFKRDKRIKWLSANKIILRVRKFLRKK